MIHPPDTTTDIYATVLDIIGVKQPKQSKRDSLSFMSVLSGGNGKRKYNVTESFPPTATVGGILPVAGASAVDDGRVVGDSRFRLIARPVFDAATNAYVCSPGSQQDPFKDCLNENTGIYEKVINLEFYDLEHDPFENDALVVDEMSPYQLEAFLKLCDAINNVSSRAIYYQNGADCHADGSNLTNIDPL